MWNYPVGKEHADRSIADCVPTTGSVRVDYRLRCEAVKT